MTESVFEFDTAAIRTWSFSEDEQVWKSVVGLGRLPSCRGGSLALLPLSFSIHHALVEKPDDSITVFQIARLDGYWKYPKIKEGFTTYTDFSLVPVNGHKEAKKAIEHIRKLAKSDDSTYSPGAKLFRFKSLILRDEVVSKPDSTDVNEVLGKIGEKRESWEWSMDPMEFDIAIFPVRVGGVEKVRFILYFGETGKPLFDKDCFDVGYHEADVEVIMSLLQSIR